MSIFSSLFGKGKKTSASLKQSFARSEHPAPSGALPTGHSYRSNGVLEMSSSDRLVKERIADEFETAKDLQDTTSDLFADYDDYSKDVNTLIGYNLFILPREDALTSQLENAQYVLEDVLKEYFISENNNESKLNGAWIESGSYLQEEVASRQSEILNALYDIASAQQLYYAISDEQIRMSGGTYDSEREHLFCFYDCDGNEVYDSKSVTAQTLSIFGEKEGSYNAFLVCIYLYGQDNSISHSRDKIKAKIDEDGKHILYTDRQEQILRKMHERACQLSGVNDTPFSSLKAVTLLGYERLLSPDLTIRDLADLGLTRTDAQAYLLDRDLLGALATSNENKGKLKFIMNAMQRKALTSAISSIKQRRENNLMYMDNDTRQRNIYFDLASKKAKSIEGDIAYLDGITQKEVLVVNSEVVSDCKNLEAKKRLQDISEKIKRTIKLPPSASEASLECGVYPQEILALLKGVDGYLESAQNAFYYDHTAIIGGSSNLSAMKKRTIYLKYITPDDYRTLKDELEVDNGDIENE